MKQTNNRQSRKEFPPLTFSSFLSVSAEIVLCPLAIQLLSHSAFAVSICYCIWSTDEWFSFHMSSRALSSAFRMKRESAATNKYEKKIIHALFLIIFLAVFSLFVIFLLNIIDIICIILPIRNKIQICTPRTFKLNWLIF